MRQLAMAVRLVALLLAAPLSLAAGPALAGPPFITDDAEPTDTGHWEIYAFADGTRTPGQTNGSFGLDFNYGPVKDLQITAVVPFDYATGADPTFGKVELAAKYRFLHQAPGSPMPDVAFFPRVFLPTDKAGGRASLLLPLWAQKDFGPWSLFGGGGYTINPGPKPGSGSRNFWQAGAVLSRPVSKRLTLGAELYHQTPDASDAKPYTALNLGALYRLTDHWSLLASGGPGLQNARDQGRYVFYVSLKADY